MFITDIEISPYKLKEGERDSNEFVYSQDSKGYCYMPKDYNGVADVFYNHISLLGKKNNTDTTKWIDTLNHEFLHFILYQLGVEDKQIHELLINFLLS